MKTKIVSLAVCLLVTAMCCCCKAEIPQGVWLKKTFNGDDNTYPVEQYLELNFDNPESMDGKQFYGSIELPDCSEMDIIKFGKPEISGSTAKCKAYFYYMDLFSEEGEKPEAVFKNRTEDCVITYSQSLNTIKINIGKDLEYSFDSNDRRNLILCNADKVNIRKAPVNGQKIGTMTCQQTLPLVSVVRQKKGDDWYEVRLPDGSSGFVSSRYTFKVSPSRISIPAGFIKPDISYARGFDNRDPNAVYEVTLEFRRKGNEIMCGQNVMYPLSTRMGWSMYYLGHIENNKFIFDRSLSMYEGGMEIFENGDFVKFAKSGTKMDTPEIYYFDSDYYNGRVFDADGNEYSAVEH